MAITAIFALSACAGQVSKGEINDPYEASSRKVHAFNKGFDTILVSPAAKGYGFVTPPVLVRMIDNFAGYMGLPGQAANNILQLDLKGLGETVLTFALNTLTFGVGDLASEVGVPDNNADFGQTLFVWRVSQGVYHEFPFLGPSTTRDTVGFFVDLALNPINFLNASSADEAGIALIILDRLGDRNQYSALYDEILYNSEDSYATARSLYLQNREFFLNKGVAEDSLEDPFADF